jgi:hypothetical protein
MGGLEMDTFLFLRNCECGSTLGLAIDKEKFDAGDWADFIGYVNQRSKRSNKEFLDVLENDVIPEYNQYLEDKLKS